MNKSHILIISCIVILVTLHTIDIKLFVAISQSGISDREYVYDSYNCVNFSYDSVTYLTANGFDARIMKLYPMDGNIGHMVVAVIDEDKTTVVLPQTGVFFDISDMNKYYQTYYDATGVMLYRYEIGG